MEEKRTIILDKYDYKLTINALNEFRNKKIVEGVNIEIIDNLIMKLLNSPVKRTLTLNKDMKGKYNESR